jgi:hypothetical protein
MSWMSRLSRLTPSLVALSLVLGGIACRGVGGSDECPVPPEDVTIGTTEECVRQAFFEGCDLQIPTPPWEHRTLYSVESDRDVTVWFKASDQRDEAYDFVVVLSHTSGVASGTPVVTFESEAEVVVDGTRVRLYGSRDSRNATWDAECVSYFAAAFDRDTESDDLDAALLSAIERSLGLATR